MLRSRFLASALVVLLISVFASDALGAKPQPPPPQPTMTAMVNAPAGTGCSLAIVAADDAGTLYLGNLCASPPFYSVAAQLPSAVSSLAVGGVQGQLFIGLKTGDVYRVINIGAPLPWPLEYWGNALAVSGPRLNPSVLPTPSFAPSVVSDPTTTEDGTPAAVRPGAEK